MAIRDACEESSVLEPKLDAFYFGNAIQSIPTYATAGELLSYDTRWCAEQLNKNVKAYDNDGVRGVVEDWERDPQVFPMGNFDEVMMTVGSSLSFQMYDNDFGRISSMGRYQRFWGGKEAGALISRLVWRLTHAKTETERKAE
ncbi:hypothetical protein ACFX2J_004371 [Malus domestica]